MTTSNVPHLREQPVPEAKAKAKPDEVKSEPAKGRLAKASESSDAAVQNLLAEQEIHRMNGDDDKVADTVRRLADLGYE